MTSSAPLATLVLFCRRPTLAEGKQRLAASLGAATALELSRYLLECAFEDLREWPGPAIVAPAKASDADWAADSAGRPVQVIAQPTGNLGARLNHIDRQARAQGHQQLIFIGSDAPSLSGTDLAAASGALAHFDVVLTPADDGGVVAMANGQPWPELNSLPWSTAELGEALAALCRTRGLAVTVLPARRDVDVEADLATLRTDLGGDDRPARVALRHWLTDRGYGR